MSQKIAMQGLLGDAIATVQKDTSPKPRRNRREHRQLGRVMGTTRKRDLRIARHPVFGPEARLTFGPKSSNPTTRKVAKRRQRHYAKYNMVFLKNRPSTSTHTLTSQSDYTKPYTLSSRKKNRDS